MIKNSTLIAAVKAPDYYIENFNKNNQFEGNYNEVYSDLYFECLEQALELFTYDKNENNYEYIWACYASGCGFIEKPDYDCDESFQICFNIGKLGNEVKKSYFDDFRNIGYLYLTFKEIVKLIGKPTWHQTLKNQTFGKSTYKFDGEKYSIYNYKNGSLKGKIEWHFQGSKEKFENLLNKIAC